MEGEHEPFEGAWLVKERAGRGATMAPSLVELVELVPACRLSVIVDGPRILLDLVPNWRRRRRPGRDPVFPMSRDTAAALLGALNEALGKPLDASDIKG